MAEPATAEILGVGAHRRPGIIRYDDPVWSRSCPFIIEVATQAFDRDMLGVGSSPYFGDAGNVGLRVPNTPTVDQRHRYLFRLLGIQVANNRALLVRGLRQMLTIGGYPATGGRAPVGSATPPVELEVTSPGWHFVDGNVSWHLRVENDFQTRLHVVDSAQQPGTSPSLEGLDPALIYTAPITGAYNPPGAGIPPGRDVGELGTFHDVRFPWGQTDWELSIPLIRGPGTVVFYASVHQTNPATRPATYSPAGGFGLRPEDQFVATLERDAIGAFYQRVAGALTVELFPCCG